MVDGEPPISADTNVEDLINRCRAVASVFIRRRMHCVGCSMARFETVADVCEIYHQPLDVVLADLRAALTQEERL
jgi:hybrid cluster-associated redox disulfide protein